MKLTVGVAAAVAAVGLAGCADTTALQNDINSLKAQVSNLQGQVASVRASADGAAQQARAAQQAADGANSTAHRALDLANEDQKRVDALNEKVDRMFKRSVSK
jgi:outer membrane murein-binding lipoprotein Lpp